MPKWASSVTRSGWQLLHFSNVILDIPLQLHFGALLKRGGFEKRTKPQVMRNPQVVEKK